MLFSPAQNIGLFEESLRKEREKEIDVLIDCKEPLKEKVMEGVSFSMWKERGCTRKTFDSYAVNFLPSVADTCRWMVFSPSNLYQNDKRIERMQDFQKKEMMQFLLLFLSSQYFPLSLFPFPFTDSLNSYKRNWIASTNRPQDVKFFSFLSQRRKKGKRERERNRCNTWFERREKEKKTGRKTVPSQEEKDHHESEDGRWKIVQYFLFRFLLRRKSRRRSNDCKEWRGW